MGTKTKLSRSVGNVAYKWNKQKQDSKFSVMDIIKNLNIEGLYKCTNIRVA